MPHPFDRFHATPARALLEEHAAAIDVFETANARLWLERDNRAAERFAQEYGLRRGAGSDAHVPAGIGTAALRLAPFEDPMSFLSAVEGAEIVRKPRSMLRLQLEKRRRQRAKRAEARGPQGSAGSGRTPTQCLRTSSTSVTWRVRSARSTHSAMRSPAVGTPPRASPCSAPGIRSATSSCSSTTPRRPS